MLAADYGTSKHGTFEIIIATSFWLLTRAPSNLHNGCVFSPERHLVRFIFIFTGPVDIECNTFKDDKIMSLVERTILSPVTRWALSLGKFDPRHIISVSNIVVMVFPGFL